MLVAYQPRYTCRYMTSKPGIPGCVLGGGLATHRPSPIVTVSLSIQLGLKSQETTMYPDVQLYIDGAWTDAAAGRKLVVINPATGEPAGKVAHADRADLDRPLGAPDNGFAHRPNVSPHDRPT